MNTKYNKKNHKDILNSVKKKKKKYKNIKTRVTIYPI